MKPKTEKKSFLHALFAYAAGEKKKLLLSVVLSVLSVTLGLVPFYCMYRLICLFTADVVTAGGITLWCLSALAAYAAKILTFTLSTGISHSMAYTILERLRLRLADRFLHAPLGDVESHTIAAAVGRLHGSDLQDQRQKLCKVRRIRKLHEQHNR